MSRMRRMKMTKALPAQVPPTQVPPRPPLNFPQVCVAAGALPPTEENPHGVLVWSHMGANPDEMTIKLLEEGIIQWQAYIAAKKKQTWARVSQTGLVMPDGAPAIVERQVQE